MANFRTHVTVGAFVSAGLATVAAGFDGITAKHAAAFAALGTFGSILPDIDSDRSSAIDLVFTLVAAFLGIFAVVWFFTLWPILYVLVLGISVYLAVRYPVKFLFERLTKHRGIFHSVLACLMMGLLTTVTAHVLLSVNTLHAWFAGSFVALGYLSHLILDEIYAVDFSNQRIRKSFGSALKIASLKHPVASVVTALMATGFFWIRPESDRFVQLVFNPDSYVPLIRLFVT